MENVLKHLPFSICARRGDLSGNMAAGIFLELLATWYGKRRFRYRPKRRRQQQLRYSQFPPQEITSRSENAWARSNGMTFSYLIYVL